MPKRATPGAHEGDAFFSNTAAESDLVDVLRVLDDVSRCFTCVHFHYRDETELQDGIERVLTVNAIPFEREAEIGPGERVDFMVAQRIALEVKIQGAASAIYRQLYRYAKCPTVKGLAIVHASRRFTIDKDALTDIDGRSLPIRVIRLQGSWI